jgi:hypothetical protein
MAKREDGEREYQDFCRAHDAIVRTVERLRRGGLTDEWTILQALMAHATELTATRHGPKAGRVFLRKLLYPPHWETCADCRLVTVPNAHLTFWMAERDRDEGTRKVVVGKVVIPTAELVRMARQLCALEDDPGEQPARIKQVVTLQ